MYDRQANNKSMADRRDRQTHADKHGQTRVDKDTDRYTQQTYRQLQTDKLIHTKTHSHTDSQVDTETKTHTLAYR